MNALDLVWVGLGGGIGSLFRWWIGRLIGEREHTGFPVGTLVINVTGAFAIGYLSNLLGVDWRDRYSTAIIAGVLTGGLGGYTTFSTMELDAVKLARQSTGQALLYLSLSVIAGLAAAALGAGLASI